jgi:ssDNA-specific exonuclease RecJ
MFIEHPVKKSYMTPTGVKHHFNQYYKHVIPMVSFSLHIKTKSNQMVANRLVSI